MSLIKGESVNRWQLIKSNLDDYAATKLSLNQDVYQSEAKTNQHNQAIAKLLQSYSRIYGDPETAVDIYAKACSVDASTLDLAKMGSVFANSGKSPFTKKQILLARSVSHVLAQMATAGLNENSGTWLYTVGLPAKSSVGGGILAIAPGKFSLAVYSPPLDEAGNSVRAQKAIEYIANQAQVNVFNAD